MKTIYAILGIKLIIAIVLGIGWIKCVIKLSNCDFSDKTSYKAEIFYTVGTFTGIGGIVGYMDFGK